MSGRRKAHYAGTYQRRAKQVRQQAYADPMTRCWQCKRTLAEHQRKWQAGHVNDGQVGGLLVAECEQCNLSRGATAGNRKRVEPTTRIWRSPPPTN